MTSRREDEDGVLAGWQRQWTRAMEDSLLEYDGSDDASKSPAYPAIPVRCRSLPGLCVEEGHRRRTVRMCGCQLDDCCAPMHSDIDAVSVPTPDIPLQRGHI